MIKPTYCYWSVADGAYGALMERCVRSAREAGVFKPFHVLTDRRLEGCECYDSLECEKTHGLFKLHLLKAAASELPFEYLVWLDADSIFVRNPVDILAPLRRAPLHVPLEMNLSAMTEDREWRGISCFRWRDLFRSAGITNQVYLSQTAFWIVQREAIDDIFEQAFFLLNVAKKEGVTLEVSAALGYAMQIFCASPEDHLLTAHPEIWASDDMGCFGEAPPDGREWPWRHPLSDEATLVHPSIVHLPRRRLLRPLPPPQYAQREAATQAPESLCSPVN